MAPSSSAQKLSTFAKEKRFSGKGPLSVALVVTQHAKEMGLPLDPEELVTAGGGQVLGSGRTAVQAVLKRHGIRRILAKEGGRTSRGSLGKMRDYVAFLNELEPGTSLDDVELFWVDQVRRFFAARPFRLNVDASKGVRAVVAGLIDQARKRENEASGVSYRGALLQHLVGATLSCLHTEVSHNSYSTADAPKGRAGDFVLGDVVIHVTTSPGEALIGRCVENLEDGYRPIVVTLRDGVFVADGLARRRVIDERIDILDLQQFLAARVYEMGDFTSDGRRAALSSIIDQYNQIVDEVETDHSMKIRIG